jgi:hypothetical protein
MNYRAISDDTVKLRTGKTWDQWFNVLGKFDVKKNGHTAATKFAREKHKASTWWAQVVVIRYEKDKKLR